MAATRFRNSLVSWVKPWVPPRLLDLYRSLRGPDPVRAAWPPGQATGFVLPVATLYELFPDLDRMEVGIPVSHSCEQDEWALPLHELVTLASICKYARPSRIFEIGTYTGLSTLVMAMNTPSETEICTLDLSPSQRATHKHGLGIGGFSEFGVGAYYQSTPFEKKIRQLWGNSLVYDYSSFAGSIDLVFIDGDHVYDFAKKDTENAFRMVRSGGMIIWDDYIWNERHPECAGVTRCLNELRGSRKLFQIAGTRLAIYLDNCGAGYSS